MLAKLTLEQKIELIGGVDGMFTHAIPSIDLPRFKMSDASVGVRTWGPTTAYAGGVALAATWDPDFARKLGESLGKDARARSVNFLLGPGVNIARSPGRRPQLRIPLRRSLSQLRASWCPIIEGVQSQGVIATVKHFAINNQEYNRHNVTSEVDERTMREIYLPAFEAAVTKGHVDAVMNSYNLINGVHATQNEFLNLKVLKGEWGFKGILMSDWDATYDAVGAANNGLDLEMPRPRFMNAQALLPAIHDGSGQRIHHRRQGAAHPPHRAALRLHRSSAVRSVQLHLLRLPIGPSPCRARSRASRCSRMKAIFCRSIRAKVKTIAIIGPDAWPAVPGGGGSSEATAFRSRQHRVPASPTCSARSARALRRAACRR